MSSLDKFGNGRGWCCWWCCRWCVCWCWLWWGWLCWLCWLFAASVAALGAATVAAAMVRRRVLAAEASPEKKVRGSSSGSPPAALVVDRATAVDGTGGSSAKAVEASSEPPCWVVFGISLLCISVIGCVIVSFLALEQRIAALENRVLDLTVNLIQQGRDKEHLEVRLEEVTEMLEARIGDCQGVGFGADGSRGLDNQAGFHDSWPYAQPAPASEWPMPRRGLDSLDTYARGSSQGKGRKERRNLDAYGDLYGSRSGFGGRGFGADYGPYDDLYPRSRWDGDGLGRDRYKSSKSSLFGNDGEDPCRGEDHLDYGWKRPSSFGRPAGGYDDFGGDSDRYGYSDYEGGLGAARGFPSRQLKRAFRNRTRAVERFLRKGHLLNDSVRDVPRGVDESPAWRIPAVVHQTWKTDALPAKYARHIASWRYLHPHWRVEFWDDRRGRDLVARSFPEYLQEFDLMSGIKKADVVRIVALYVEGGVYADIDVEAVQPFDALVEAAAGAKAGVLLGEENIVHAVLLERRSKWLVSNAVMASSKGHPFWREALRAIFRDTYCGDDPVQCTGPRLLERLSWQHILRNPACGRWGCLARLPYKYFSPVLARWNAHNMVKECKPGSTSDWSLRTIGGLQGQRLRELRACTLLEHALQYPEVLRSARRTFAVHHWQCSWCRQDDAMRQSISLQEVVWLAGNMSLAGSATLRA